MTILAQEIIYKISPIGIIIVLSCAAIGISFGLIGMELDKPKLFVIGIISFLILIALAIYDSTSHPTLINKPNKIRYTVEITNDNIWKEIATNYKVKEKPYEEREIYIIEGDYDNVNNH